MRNKNDLFTIWQAVDWLECKTWDKVDDCWIPADNDTTSMIYASKVIGNYELVLTIFGVGDEVSGVTVKLMLSKHLSFDTTASICLIQKEMEQDTDMLLSEVKKANGILEVFERKCPKEGFTIGLEELANMLQ